MHVAMSMTVQFFFSFSRSVVLSLDTFAPRRHLATWETFLVVMAGRKGLRESNE